MASIFLTLRSKYILSQVTLSKHEYVCRNVMKEEQTISWIFLATAFASKTQPSDSERILFVAEGINKSVPTQQELESSLSWLEKKGLINKFGNKYGLTHKGELEIKKASTNTKIHIRIWETLELTIKKLA